MNGCIWQLFDSEFRKFRIREIEVVGLKRPFTLQRPPDRVVDWRLRPQIIVVQIDERCVQPIDSSVRLLEELIRIWQRVEWELTT
jgi:hypothetical protein